MLAADSAQVNWDTEKKRWSVRVKVGEEVIRRPIRDLSRSADDDALRSAAIETAKADGYDVDPAKVEIAH